jgi:hypothetical protein
VDPPARRQDARRGRLRRADLARQDRRDRGSHALRHGDDEHQGAAVHRLIAVLGGAAATAALAGCGATGPTSTTQHHSSAELAAADAVPAPPRGALPVGTPQALRADPFASEWAPLRRAATARAAPSAGARVVTRLAALTPESTTNLVLALGRAHDAQGHLWIRARLPDGRSGWIARASLGGYVVVHTRLVVDRARLRLTLLRDGRPVFRAPIGIGAPGTPTPAGHFYVRDRLTRYASPFYGPIAFGTSAQSPTLTDWPAGGFVGIHGTNEPKLIPGRISHGCIRLRNADILRLARLLPVGTPLTIV